MSSRDLAPAASGGAGTPAPPITGRWQREVFDTVAAQSGDATALTIRECIFARTGQRPGFGSLYVALMELERKGLLSSEWGEATAERGGHRKRLYKVSAAFRGGASSRPPVDVAEIPGTNTKSILHTAPGVGG